MSVALADWHELGKAYPPAMDKLKETRDDATKQVIKHKHDVRESFHDMSSINRELDEEETTVATFIRLDKDAPDVARNVYDLAQRSLLKAKQFALCRKYLEPEKSYARIVEIYGMDIEFAEKHVPLAEKDHQLEVAERWFLNDSATLIVLLVVNKRQQEAESFAAKARSKSKYSRRDELIDAALKGRLPNLMHF